VFDGQPTPGADGRATNLSGFYWPNGLLKKQEFLVPLPGW
jgi:hypothetical protein